MGQLDNQTDSQPVGSLKGVIHLHARPLIESVAAEQATPKAAAKTEQPKTEQPKPEASKPGQEQDATQPRDKEAQERLLKEQQLKDGLLVPSLWKSDEAKLVHTAAAGSKDFNKRALEEAPINMDKFDDARARWYENKAAREEEERNREEEERTIANHKDFVRKQAVVDAILDPTLTPAMGAFLNAALRLEDRVPLFGRQMGKIMVGGALTGLAAHSVDTLARSQTTPGSLADKVFTPTTTELYAVGLTAGMPLPLKIRIPIAAATWVGAKAANYYFADMK